MNIQELRSMNVQIENYPSIFLTLKCDQKIGCFDIFDKQEFGLKKGTIGELKCFETHPLLINYSENKIVTLPADYYFSFTRNYAALENELEVT